jgi:hypothetical protein
MRNEDGRDPSSPRRVPVQVYLSEEARAVFGKVRALAKELQRPSVSNSELVEQLLLVLDQRKFSLEGIGYSLDDVLQRYSRLKAEVASAHAQLRLLHEEPVRVTRRSMPKILKMLETPPSRQAIAAEVRRTNGIAGSFALRALVKDLEPLFGKARADPELHDKLKRRVGAYLEGLFGAA